MTQRNGSDSVTLEVVLQSMGETNRAFHVYGGGWIPKSQVRKLVVKREERRCKTLYANGSSGSTPVRVADMTVPRWLAIQIGNGGVPHGIVEPGTVVVLEPTEGETP